MGRFGNNNSPSPTTMKQNKKQDQKKKSPLRGRTAINAPGEESALEKKMKLQQEAKVIMKRVAQITANFNNIISEATMLGEQPSSQDSGDVNFGPLDALENPQHRQQQSNKSQLSTASSQIAPPIPKTKADLQFLEYQVNKGKVTMLMVDHEKLGVEKSKLLNSLRDWFYFENNKYQENSAPPDDGYYESESDEEKYDIYQGSYITSLRDATADVSGAARKLGDTNEVTHKKFASTFNRIKRLYNDSLQKSTIADNSNQSESTDYELKIRNFEKELLDLSMELARVNESAIQERNASKKRETQINTESKHSGVQLAKLETMVAELAAQVEMLEAQKNAADTKARTLEQIVREPMLAGKFGGGGNGEWEKEKNELEERLRASNLSKEAIASELTQKKLRLSALENQMADVQQNTQMLIKAAVNKAKKEGMEAVGENLRKLEAQLEECQRTSTDCQDKEKEAQEMAASLKSQLEGIGAEKDSEIKKLKSELAEKTTLLELSEKEKEKMKEKERERKKEKEASLSERNSLNESSGKIEEQNTLLKDQANEIEKLKSKIEKAKEEAKENERKLKSAEEKKSKLESRVEAMEEAKVSAEKTAAETHALEGGGMKNEEAKKALLEANALRQQLKLAEEALRKKEFECDTIKMELSSARDEIGQVKEELVTMIDEKRDSVELQEVVKQKEADEISRKEKEAQAQGELAKELERRSTELSEREGLTMKKLSYFCNLVVEQVGEGEEKGEVVLKGEEEQVWIQAEKDLIALLARNTVAEVVPQDRAAYDRNIAMLEEKVRELDGGNVNEIRELQKRLSDCEGELSTAEAHGHELTAKNAELSRTVAELENLLKKSKYGIETLMREAEGRGEGRGEEGGGEAAMRSLRDSLGEGISAVMDKNSEAAVEISNRRRITAMESLGKVKKLNSFKAAQMSRKRESFGDDEATGGVVGGDKKSRITLLRNVSSGVQSGVGGGGDGGEMGEWEGRQGGARGRDALESFAEGEGETEGEGEGEGEDRDSGIFESVNGDNVSAQDDLVDEIVIQSASPASLGGYGDGDARLSPFGDGGDNGDGGGDKSDVGDRNNGMADTGKESSSISAIKRVGSGLGGSMSIAMKMNARKKQKAAEEANAEAEAKKEADTERSNDDNAAVGKGAGTTFGERLMYHGLKKQKSAIFGAIKHSSAANLVSQMQQRAAAQEEIDRHEREAKEKQAELERAVMESQKLNQQINTAKEAGNVAVLANLEEKVLEAEKNKNEIEQNIGLLSSVIKGKAEELVATELELDKMAEVEDFDKEMIKNMEHDLGALEKVKNLKEKDRGRAIEKGNELIHKLEVKLEDSKRWVGEEEAGVEGGSVVHLPVEGDEEGDEVKTGKEDIKIIEKVVIKEVTEEVQVDDNGGRSGNNSNAALAANMSHVLKKNLEKEKKKNMKLRDTIDELKGEVDSIKSKLERSKEREGLLKMELVKEKANNKGNENNDHDSDGEASIDASVESIGSSVVVPNEEETPDPFTLDDLDMDYDEASLVSVCECRGRIVLKLEQLDSILEKKVNQSNPQLHQFRQALVQIQDEMILELAQFGVEPCAALRSQLEKTFLKRKTMNAWKGMLGSNNDSDDKSMWELPPQLSSLKDAIEAAGGWRAALYLDSGDVNLRCVIDNWPPKDQIEMLLDVRAFLERDVAEKTQALDTVEIKREGEKEKVKKLESDLKALRKSSKAQMMKARKERKDGDGSISIEKLNEERKIFAALHAKTAQFAHDILKMSMPDADGKRECIINGIKELGEGNNKRVLRSPMSSRRGTMQTVTAIGCGGGSPRQSMRFIEPPSPEASSPGAFMDNVAERLKDDGTNEEDELEKAQEVIEKSNKRLMNTRTFARKMSVDPQAMQLLAKNPKNFVEEAIESTENVKIEISGGMDAMDKALESLKSYKKAEKEKKEQESGLKAREIEILVESQLAMKRQYDALRSDYISEDVEDVISALRDRIGLLEKELFDSKKRCDMIENFRLESDELEGAGKLETLEHLMKNTSPVMKLHNSLVVKKMKVGDQLNRITEEIRLLKCKINTGGQVKKLVELKKKVAKEHENLNFRLKSVKEEYDGSMKILKDLYERVGEATTALFENTSYRGLVHWAKLHEARVDLRVHDSDVERRLAVNSKSIGLTDGLEGELMKNDDEYRSMGANFGASLGGILGEVKEGRRGGNHGLLNIPGRPGTTPGNYNEGGGGGSFDRLILKTPSHALQRKKMAMEINGSDFGDVDILAKASVEDRKTAGRVTDLAADREREMGTYEKIDLNNTNYVLPPTTSSSLGTTLSPQKLYK